MTTAVQHALVRRHTTILGADGRPAQTMESAQQADLRRASGRVIKAYSNYLSALYGTKIGSFYRATDPFMNHPWVYAAAMAVATNISQPPFKMMRETEEQTKLRMKLAEKDGRPFIARAGRGRQAVKRHLLASSRFFGRRIKGLEDFLEHPMQETLDHPNDTMDGSMLWQATTLWMMLRGGCIWVMFGPNSAPLKPGEIPTEIWPLPPELFRPLMSGNRIVGWGFNFPRAMGGGSQGAYRTLLYHEVAYYKFINPDISNLFAGFAPTSAVSAPILLDLKSVEYTKSQYDNECRIGGMLQTDQTFDDEEEKTKYLADFEQRNKGVDKNHKTVMLSGGMKYIANQLAPRDMEYQEMRKWDREEILAALGVPKSIMSITEGLNYATQRSQDKNFWDKRLLPLMRSYESTFDRVLLYQEQDNVVGAFDLSQVEALREGLDLAIATADKLTSSNLHVPPNVAFPMVGLDIEPYLGDDRVLVSGMLSTVDYVLTAAEEPPPPPVDPNAPKAPPVKDPADPTKQIGAIIRAGKMPKADQWKRLMRLVQQPSERDFTNSWRRFIRKDKNAALEHFDAYAHAHGLKSMFKAGDVDPDSLLVPLKDTEKRLRQATRPSYTKSMQGTLEYTVEELGGVPTFHLDDPTIISALDDREDILAGSAPKTLQRSLRESLRKGIDKGETMGQLRDRVAKVYDISGSSAKSLQIARTESAGFMNEIRDRVFNAQGLDEREWTTAGDEVVRETHTIYGKAGPQKSGFNYLTLAERDGEGELTYPGDPSAPADEVVNCRCCQIPV